MGMQGVNSYMQNFSEVVLVEVRSENLRRQAKQSKHKEVHTMKKFRKGFTLVELLIVIGVIGILGAMGMMGGQEANNIATATKIVEDFNIISAAMNMYYADNKALCDLGKQSETDGANDIDAAFIKTGITPYMKSVASIVTDNAAESKYLITIHSDKTWWLTYTIPAANLTKVGGILKNKAAQQGLSKTVGATTNDYDGTATVCMKVH